jgi:hypothetical protein
LKELKQQIEKNDASSIEVKTRTQIDVDAKIALERILVKAQHIHVQMCKFKSLKGSLPKLHYSRKYWKGLLKLEDAKRGHHPKYNMQVHQLKVSCWICHMKRKIWM